MYNTFIELTLTKKQSDFHSLLHQIDHKEDVRESRIEIGFADEYSDLS